ncbi:MAG: ATP-grasp domain-containing protein [Bryobacterales bacterium]|nr:ATP-grasp domain-containing protein [Bryobacterales bacterium]
MFEGKHLLLVATKAGYQTRMFAEAAGALGVRCTLATDRCNRLDDPWGDRAVAVRFQDPIGSLPTLRAAGPFDAVTAVGDRPTLLAALCADHAGLQFHPPHAVEAARSKYLSKERFRAADLPLPWYGRYRLEEDPSAVVPYPCVLKPLVLSGSRGVIRADSPPEFRAALDRIRRLLSEGEIRRMKNEQNKFVQVERFIPGMEFAIEGLVTGGEVKVLAIFDKPDPLDGPYFEETIYVTPSRQPKTVQDDIVRTVQRAAEALGLRHGPLHAEVRVNPEGVWILEVAGRPIGGYCGRTLRFDGGMTLEELILRHALGEDVSSVEREPASAGVMMIPVPKAGIFRAVSGLDEARAFPGIEDIIISAKPGQQLKSYPEANSYPGFLFARGDDPLLVETALRNAHRALRFEIMTELA